MLKKIMICTESFSAQDIENVDCTGILFLSENLELVHQLRKKVCCAPILTEKNMHEDFSQLPFAVSEIDELEPEDFEHLYKRLAGIPWDILETKRCKVREMTTEDVERLYEIYNLPGVSDFVEPLHEKKEDEISYIKDYQKYVYGFYGYGIWIVEDKESGKIIGRAGLDPKDGIIEIGYLLDPKWQGKGIAYEVCCAILDYAKKEIEGNIISAKVSVDNIRSIRLLEKLGFQKETAEAETGFEKYVFPL